ncbi:MAG: hypothetical protein GX119_04725 [Syntrophomonadaceae bacterium]|jgi:hypothetical protein|nr:hypothetical protein [Syntrophomonadaceae bacterium]
MKIIFNTVIDLETMQKMESYIKKALLEAEQDKKQYINKAYLTDLALKEYLHRITQ